KKRRERQFMRLKNLLTVGVMISQVGYFTPALYSQSLLNVDFGIGTSSGKVGYAAVGKSDNDFWNLYSRDDGNGGYRDFGTVSNLKWADGTVSSVGLTVANAPGAWLNGLDDPMYNVYLYPFNADNITVTVTDLRSEERRVGKEGNCGRGMDRFNEIFEIQD